MSEDLSIKVLHSIPGRIRLRLSVAPQNTDEMQETVKNHPGIDQVLFSPVTRSLLLRYDPEETSREELIIRVAVFISSEYDLTPVKVFSDTKLAEMSDTAFFSGFSIVVSVLSRLIPQTKPYRRAIDWIAGMGTAFSILEHGYQEYKERGNFDPEVLSIIYLMTSFSQNKLLLAALFTWIAAFGRHLITYSSKNVVIVPRRVPGSPREKQQYEVVINPIHQLPGRMMLLRVLPMAIMHTATGDQTMVHGTLLEQIQKVSLDHGDVLEGFGTFKNGIPIKMQYQTKLA